jgi:hypothetical protein
MDLNDFYKTYNKILECSSCSNYGLFDHPSDDCPLNALNLQDDSNTSCNLPCLNDISSIVHNASSFATSLNDEF